MRLVVIGAICGLAWAAGFRGFMAEVAGPTSSIEWGGTFWGILLPGLVTGALLGLAEHLRRTGGVPGRRLVRPAPRMSGVLPAQELCEPPHRRPGVPARPLALSRGTYPNRLSASTLTVRGSLLRCRFPRRSPIRPAMRRAHILNRRTHDTHCGRDEPRPPGAC